MLSPLSDPVSDVGCDDAGADPDHAILEVPILEGPGSHAGPAGLGVSRQGRDPPARPGIRHAAPSPCRPEWTATPNPRAWPTQLAARAENTCG